MQEKGYHKRDKLEGGEMYLRLNWSELEWKLMLPSYNDRPQGMKVA